MTSCKRELESALYTRMPGVEDAAQRLASAGDKKIYARGLLNFCSAALLIVLLTKEHLFYIIPLQMPGGNWKDFFRFGRKPRRRRYDWDGELQGWLRELIDSAVADGQARRELMGSWGSLTLREQQIVAFVCLGYTNPQIAVRLRLSVETVKTHMKNVLVKLRLHSKTELRLMFASWDFGEWDR